MDSAISDLALDLGVFALDRELETANSHGVQGAAHGVEANRMDEPPASM